ncbi:hypothetical protein HZS_420 [Henneguya salminicola]|nr:hypothetical protein HZS_420 [Henneguya salminicola]
MVKKYHLKYLFAAPSSGGQELEGYYKNCRRNIRIFSQPFLKGAVHRQPYPTTLNTLENVTERTGSVFHSITLIHARHISPIISGGLRSLSDTYLMVNPSVKFVDFITGACINTIKNT